MAVTVMAVLVSCFAAVSITLKWILWKTFLFKEQSPRRKFWLSQTKPEVRGLGWQPKKKLNSEVIVPIITRVFVIVGRVLWAILTRWPRLGPLRPRFLSGLCESTKACPVLVSQPKPVANDNQYGAHLFTFVLCNKCSFKARKWTINTQLIHNLTVFY